MTATAGRRTTRSPRSRRGSVQQVPGSAAVRPDDRHRGRSGDGRPRLPARDPATKAVQRGDDEGLTPLADAAINERGKVTAAPEGLTLLNAGQAAARTAELDAFSVPTANGAIKASGLSRAYEGSPTRAYDAACDCIKEASTGLTWTADNERGLVHRRRRQAASPGLAGQRRPRRTSPGPSPIPTISGPFLGILAWNFGFAFASVLITFVAGPARRDGPELAATCGPCASTAC